MPDEHDGSSEFTFDLEFSQNVEAGYKRIRDKAGTISGGRINQAKRKTQGSNQSWTGPTGAGDITITLPETTDCDDDGAICTADGGMLNHSTSDTVRGPVGISIADAEVEEGDGAALAFAVALSRAASSQSDDRLGPVNTIGRFVISLLDGAHRDAVRTHRALPPATAWQCQHAQFAGAQRSCTSPSRGASGEGCRSALGTGTRSTPV